MKLNLKKIAGVVLPIASAGIALATSFYEDKKLDEKVTEKVAEVLKKQAEES